MVWNPIIFESARKHGVGDNDILHAYRNPLRVFETGELTMLIGADCHGQLLEIGLVVSDGIECIVHAMIARQRFLR